jgi:hypothetical protein
MPFSANEIRARIAACVLREASLDDFEDWFVAATWNVQQTGSRELQNLVYTVEAKLAEHSGGHIDEPTLRKSLGEMVMEHATVIAFDVPEEAVDVQTGASQDVSEPAELPVAFADIEPEVVRV